MENDTNPLRAMTLAGKARSDFFDWFYKNWQNHPNEVDYWTQSHQLEYFSKFFKQTVHNANDFYILQNEYNSKG